MKNKIRIKKNFYLILMSYIVLLLFLLLIGGIIYVTAVRVIEKEIQNASDSMLYTVRKHFDREFTKVQNAMFGVLESPYIRNLSYFETQFTGGQMSELFQNISRNIAISTTNIDNLDECFVILREQDICLERSGKSDRIAVYNRFFDSYYATAESWLTDIFETRTFSEYKILRSANGERKVALVVRYPISVGMPAKAVVVCLFNSASIMNQIIPYSYNTEIFVLNKDKNVLFGTSDEARYSIYLSEEGGGTNHGEYIKTEIKSQNMDWKYVLLFPRGTYKKDVDTVKRAAVYCYLCCLIIGLMAAVYFSKRNYRPLQDLVRKIPGDEIVRETEDEYLYIEKALRDMLENKGKMEVEIAERDAKLKGFFFSKVIRGEVDAEYLESRLLKKYGIAIEGQRCILIFDISDLGLLGARHGKKIDSGTICFVLSNVFGELMGDGFNCYFFDADGLYVCLLCASQEVDGKTLYENTCLTVSFFEENFDMAITCTMSEIGDDNASIPELFEKTKELFDIRFLVGGDRTVLRPGDFEENESDFIFAARLDQELVSAVKAGDEKGVQSAIERMFAHGMAACKTSVIRMMEYSTLSTLLKVASRLDDEEVSEIFTDIRSKDMDNPEKMRNIITDYAMRLCEEFKKRDVANNEKIKLILDFIHENFHDGDLNVNFLAERFELTNSYFSRYFKERTGEGAAEYITKYRIQRAREYLDTGRYSVIETSGMCGFQNVNVFIRAFKKIVGITPGKYKG